MKTKNNLQQIMHDRRLSYRQLERMSGISHTTINKVANGEISPTQETMVLIAKGLKMHVVDIFDFTY